jgi:pimeloyl-ACP methyl ester carboxylesterase
MLRPFRFAGLSVVSLLVILFFTQCSGRWHDPSPHSVRFVTVDKSVPLEVLDWGGTGRTLVLLAGGGNTAHVFDDFAPKLTNQYHVVGITRRGFGASGFRSDDNTADTLGKDVLDVLDALKLEKPVLIGHSFAGLEMSSVANQHPERVAGLVYLDAAYSYAFDNGKGADVMDMMKLNAPQPPGPQKQDLASFAAYRAYVGSIDGFAIPEAEFHFQRKARWFGRVGDYIDYPGGSMLMAVLSAGNKYTQIPAPACFIYASPHSLGQWVEKNPDPAVQADARKYSATLEAMDAKQIASVREAFPGDTMITIPGANHYVFMTNEAEVLQAIRAFVSGLK